MNNKKIQGLTIIEVIISIALITVVSVASISGLMRLSKTMNDSKNSIETNTVSQAIIESFHNQWRTNAYRPNPNENPDINSDNVEIWSKNVIAREFFDKNCIATDKLTDEQYDLYVAYQNNLSVIAMNRDLQEAFLVPINFQNTEEDCINTTYDDLPYSADLAKNIFIKRFTVMLDPNDPDSFNNLSFDIGKPDITCPSAEVSDCATTP